MTKATNMAAYDVLVVGGGPAGQWQPDRLHARGFSVVLMERNARIGKKLSITGKGRCNLTNNCEHRAFDERGFVESTFFVQCICCFYSAGYHAFF
jgi:predicted flavoprotein YhiN